MRMESEHFMETEIVLQAYLAVSPGHPRWANCRITSVEGWERFFRPELDPRISSRDRFEFDTFEDANSVLKDIISTPQQYWFRVACITRSCQVVPTAGAAIANGTVVRDPGGQYPQFMGKVVPYCEDAMPEYKGI